MVSVVLGEPAGEQGAQERADVDAEIEDLECAIALACLRRERGAEDSNRRGLEQTRAQREGDKPRDESGVTGHEGERKMPGHEEG